MSLRGVKSSRDENDAGVEDPDNGTDDGPHGCQVLGVREGELGGGPGDVDVPSLCWTQS